MPEMRVDRKPQLTKGKRCSRTYCSPVRLGSVCSSDMSPTSVLWQPMRSEEQGAREKKEGGGGVGSGGGITQTSVAYKQEPKAGIE